MTTPTLREAAMAAQEAIEFALPKAREEWRYSPAWNTAGQLAIVKLAGAIAALRLALTAPEQSPADGGQARHVCGLQGFGALGDVCPGCTPAAPTSGEPTAREAAETLIEAGHEFWLAVGREDYKAQGAVQWLTADDDALIIFTRGEYRQQLLANIHTLPGSTALIFSEPGDEDADVKSLDAFLRAAPGTTPPSAAQAEGAAQQPIETIRYWLNAYSDPASGDHFMGHGMVVVMLREYLAMRLAALTAAPEKLAPAPQQAETRKPRGQVSAVFLSEHKMAEPQQAAQGGERERFEEEVRKHFAPDSAKRVLARDLAGNYEEWGLMLAWEVWQAARAWVEAPFSSRQRRNLWNNSPELHKDAASFAGFERIVTLVEQAHYIGITTPAGDSE